MKTYVNPLCLPNMPVLKIPYKGRKQEEPFALGEKIAECLPKSHERFKDMFRGMILYTGENDTRTTADPAGLYYKDEWYIYGSNGALWHSKDFVQWDFTETGYVYEYAPGIVVTQDDSGKDIFYLAGNSTELFAADSPFGPFRSLGAFTYKEKAIYPQNDDVSLFCDDDGHEVSASWTLPPEPCGHLSMHTALRTVIILRLHRIVNFCMAGRANGQGLAMPFAHKDFPLVLPCKVFQPLYLVHD